MDYPEIIKEPMDLGTVKQKIKERKYSTLYQVAEDVRTIWTNCMTYNQEGSDFYKLAELLAKKWDEEYAHLLVDTQVPAAAAGGTDKASLTDKRNFAKSLYMISKEDLGKLLVEVEGKCPAALTRNAAEDEVEFNVDQLPASLLRELTEFVQSVQQQPSASSGGKNQIGGATVGAGAAAGGGSKKKSSLGKKSKTK
jgi:hypothetical protein